MKFLLESPNGPYLLRSLITWSFLVIFSLFYVFLTKPNIRLLPSISYLLSILLIALCTSLQIPNPSETQTNTTQIVTLSLILSIAISTPINLLLYTLIPKWPFVFLTCFGTISITASALLGYICSNDANLYNN